ncbi:MAG TPA: VWA domain-containing protein [Vicinamibacterales bacterium]|nr:VWA domain-containing protein [Vicinamibacterales bacterium]
MRSILALAAATLMTAGVLAQGQGVFRAGVEVVTVNVSVQKGGMPVAHLGAADFELKDNGVTQAISSLTFETLPIDVTLLLDASGSVEGARLERLKAGVIETAQLLNATDRLRLIAVQHALRQVFPFQAGATLPNVSALSAGGGTSLFDGLSAAMMRRSELDRRHLIIAYTDGLDTISSLDYPTMLATAGRADAVVHLVIPNVLSRGRSVLPALGEIAARTGGQLFTMQIDAPISEDFTRAVSEVRRSYVLRYTPHGVPVSGWHDITVSVKNGEGYVVRARKGWGGN